MKNYAMKTYRGVEVESRPIPIGEEVEWNPEPVWTTRNKKFCPHRDSNSNPLVVQPVASRSHNLTFYNYHKMKIPAW
jgi:hypothetical protein